MFQAEPAETVADVKEMILAIGHSPAVYLEACGFGSHTSRVRLVAAGIKHFFVFWIESQFDSKKSNDRVCTHISFPPIIVCAESQTSAITAGTKGAAQEVLSDLRAALSGKAGRREGGSSRPFIQPGSHAKNAG